MEIAKKEISLSDQVISGDIHIGTGESEGVRLLIQAGMKLSEHYPDVHIHTISGDSVDLLEQLDKGLYDFAVIWEPTNISAYESLALPYKDRVSLLMPSDCPLAKKSEISIADLTDLPLIISRHQKNDNLINMLDDLSPNSLNIVATYNLIFNASLMVQEGIGYAIGFDHIIDTSGNNNLTCRPIVPATKLGMYLVWKKYQVPSKAAGAYLKTIQELIS